jgi:hypothetical protein
MKYKEKHCIVKPTIVCEIKGQVGKSCLFRLKVKWRFIPARAAWWGGQHEVFVRMIK